MRKQLRATTLSVAALFVCVVAGLMASGCSKDSKTLVVNSTGTGAATLVLKVQGSSTEIGSSYEVSKNSTTTFIAELREGNSTRQLTASELNNSQSPNPSTVGAFGGNLTFVSNNVNGNVDVTLTLASNSAVTKTVQLRVVDTPNNTTTGTAGLVVKVGSTEVGSTYQVTKNSTTTVTVFNRDSNGNLTSLTVSQVNVTQSPNPSSIGTFGGNFTFVSNNTNGDVDVTLTLASNTSISKTIRLQVVDNPNNTGGGSISGAVTGIQLTPESQQAIAAHQPRKINASVNTGSGLVSASAETLPFWRVSEAQLQARQCVVDANGVFRGALAGGSFNVEAFGVGGQVTGGPSTEKARVLVGSNVVIVNTDNTAPAGLIFFAPAFMLSGMDYRYVAKNGTVEITYDAGVNVTSSDTNVVMVTTDGANKKVLRALRDGIVTISMTSTAFPNETYTHRLRVTNSNPFRQPFLSQWIVDTHISYDIMADPTDTNVTNPTRFTVVKVVNLSRCAAVSTINASDHPSPLYFDHDLNGEQAPLFDIIYTDADGVMRGIYRRVFTNPTGNVNLAFFNYAGKSKSPIVNSDYTNSTIWPFAQALEESHFFDEHDSGKRDISTQMQLPSAVNAANLHQTVFVRLDR